jgi:hypothetical protein
MLYMVRDMDIVDAQKCNIGYLLANGCKRLMTYDLTISNNILIGGTPGETCVTMKKKQQLCFTCL